MLGTNGGLIGGTRTASALGSGVGLWTPNEQAALRRNRSWPLSGDPFYSYNSLLLSMDGANNSTTFTDSSPYGLTVTANGDAKISTAQSKFGGASAVFDGAGDYVAIGSSALFGMSTGDFTIEAWIYVTDLSVNRCIASLRAASPSAQVDYGNNLAIEAGKLAFSNGSAWTSGNTSISTNTWHHVAVTRQSGAMNLWLNGSADRTSWTETSNFGSLRPAAFGATTDQFNYFIGHIDDARITKGIARYTSNFTPPTQAHLTYGGYNDPYFPATSLLLHMDGSNGSTTFTDSSVNALAVTANGNAQISTAQSKFGGASAVFDGTGDYLATAHNSALSIESGDFTAEAWVYRNASGAMHNIINKRISTPSSGYAWRINANNTLQFFFPGGSSITSTSTVSASSWVHIAVTRSANAVRQFINGTLDATTATFSNGTPNTQEVRIGVDEIAGDGLNGYIDDLRITKGVARYTANFTPPTAPFPDL